MTIGILIPCHNEEKTIRATVNSCLNQTREPDQIVVVDDASTDRSNAILRSFEGKIALITLPKNTGNKSYVQQEGLKYVKTDVFVTTDADTIIHERFLEEIERDFSHPLTAAVSGYVKSMRYNWLTACREIEYVLSQNLYKRAQAILGFVYVIPGCAGAFRTEIFKRNITFDHDTVTEDLDFTYKLHEQGFKIQYNANAWVYTQDPATLGVYAKQMSRWYGGGWQNLVKHWRLARLPLRGMELAFMYVDSFAASLLLFILPILDIIFFGKYAIGYLAMVVLVGIYAVFKDRRPELFFYAPLYLLIMAVNAWIFLGEFIKEVVFRKRNLVWYQPARVSIRKDALD